MINFIFAWPLSTGIRRQRKHYSVWWMKQSLKTLYRLRVNSSHDKDQSDLLASSWPGSGLRYFHVETCCQGGQPEQVVHHGFKWREDSMKFSRFQWVSRRNLLRNGVSDLGVTQYCLGIISNYHTCNTSLDSSISGNNVILLCSTLFPANCCMNKYVLNFRLVGSALQNMQW